MPVKGARLYPRRSCARPTLVHRWRFSVELLHVIGFQQRLARLLSSIVVVSSSAAAFATAGALALASAGVSLFTAPSALCGARAGRERGRCIAHEFRL